jgi:hypothetical protein
MLSMRSWPMKPFLFVGCLLLAAGGCGSGGSKLAPVSGRVTLADGKPLTSGFVNFRPDKTKGNTFGGEAVGEINSQGEYTLNVRGKPGAPLGAYKVTVSSTGPTTTDNTNPSAQSVINPTYSNPGTTPLEKTVVDKPAAGAYDLQIGP